MEEYSMGGNRRGKEEGEGEDQRGKENRRREGRGRVGEEYSIIIVYV